MRVSGLVVYSAYIREKLADHNIGNVMSCSIYAVLGSKEEHHKRELFWEYHFMRLRCSFTFTCRVSLTASIAWVILVGNSCIFGSLLALAPANEAVRAEALCQRAELRVQRGHWQERDLGTGIRIVMASCQITVSCFDWCGGASRLSYLTGFPPPEDGTRFVVV